MIRVEAARGLARGRLARHRRVQPEPRVDVARGRVIAPEGQRAPQQVRLQEPLPGVGARGAVRAEAVERVAQVRRAVARLHRRDHFERREAAEVRVGQDLRVLHAEAVARPHARGLVGVEHRPVRGVADGVRRDLVARRAPERHVADERVLVLVDQGTRRVPVVVGREHRRGPGAHGAVGEELGAADPHQRRLVLPGQRRRRVAVGRGVAEDVDARRECAPVGRVVGDVAGERREVVEAREPEARDVFELVVDARADGRGRRMGHEVLDERHGVVREDARRFAGRVAHDRAAGRVRRGFRDVRERERP